MSSVGNSSQETNSSQIESIVPTQQIATLENDRKDKISIPHRPRVKKSITQQNDAIKLNKLGKCTQSKSINTLYRTQLQSKSMTCTQCNEPVIQTKSGKIKPCNISKVTSHGDNDKVTPFHRMATFSSFRREGGDTTSVKTSNINRWIKSNWSKLTKDKWGLNNEVDIVKTFSGGSQKAIVSHENEIVCGMVHEARKNEFPFVINEIAMPVADRQSGRELYATPGDADSSNWKQRWCGSDTCMGCKLACRIFGCRCRCKCKKGCPCLRCPTRYPVRTISLNVLERAHLQNLYNTPCSSVQFSMCNCAVQDAPVKLHTTGAHYFAHKGLRLVDACGHHHRKARSCSSTCSEVTEFRSGKSFVAYSVKSAVRQDYQEDDDCCCKCCDQQMVSIDCQTDSRLHLGHLVQTEPQRKKCRPCCKCCRCNKKGGRCSISCKHFQVNTEGTSRAQLEHNLNATNKQHNTTSKPSSSQMQRRRSPLCCNKCTGIPYRVRGGHSSWPGVDAIAQRQHTAGTATDFLKHCGLRGAVNFDGVQDIKNAKIKDRVRGGANNMDGSCVSCKQRLQAGTNNNLFGHVIPGNEECFNIGNQESWLSRKNIARLLGMDKKQKKRYTGFTFGKHDVCDMCKIDLRRTPNIAKRFNQKLDRKQLKRLLALRNMQILQQQQFDNVENVNGPDFVNNRNCNYHYDPYVGQQHQELNDLLATNQQYNTPLNVRNFEILNHMPSQISQMLSPPKKQIHTHRKHAHHDYAHARHHHHNHKQQRTLIYKTHSTQCITKTQDQATSCLADFKQAAELGYKLNLLPPFKLDKYRKMFNEASGKFKSPITGKEYNLKLEKVDYKTGLLNSNLPLPLEIDDTLEKLPKIDDRLSVCLTEYKENNDKIINAICDAILLTKDVGAAGEIGYDSNNSTATSSNTMNSITDTDFKFFNEPLVYRTKSIMDYEKVFNNDTLLDNNKKLANNNDVLDLFIQSNPKNNIYTNKNMFKNSSMKSVIFRSKNRSNATMSTSLIFNKIKNNTSMTSTEFKAFILDDNMFQRKPNRKNSNQFKSYQLNDEVKTNNTNIISMKAVDNALEDIDGKDSMPQCSVPNFIQQNLSIFSNAISDTYSLLKILERNQEKLSNRSFDEQIEKVINYSSFINDNS